MKNKNYLLNSKICLVSIFVLIFSLSGCAKKEIYDYEPLLGLQWHMEKTEAVESLSSLELVGVREENGKTLMDFSGAVFNEFDVILTLCFSDQGLVGIDYHDTMHNLGYRKWLEKIEDTYGIPNESAVDCASWFENPVGKNTSVYLYDLVEGVQISFYGTTVTPNKTYNVRLK